jgi:UDP-glucose:glycoprotein glucosyltransferase
VYDEEVGALARRVRGEKAKEEASVVDVQAEEQIREKKKKDEERRKDEL